MIHAELKKQETQISLCCFFFFYYSKLLLSNVSCYCVIHAEPKKAGKTVLSLCCFQLLSRFFFCFFYY
jgi:hypothetical protein